MSRRSIVSIKESSKQTILLIQMFYFLTTIIPSLCTSMQNIQKISRKISRFVCDSEYQSCRNVATCCHTALFFRIISSLLFYFPPRRCKQLVNPSPNTSEQSCENSKFGGRHLRRVFLQPVRKSWRHLVTLVKVCNFQYDESYSS